MSIFINVFKYLAQLVASLFQIVSYLFSSTAMIALKNLAILVPFFRYKVEAVILNITHNMKKHLFPKKTLVLFSNHFCKTKNIINHSLIIEAIFRLLSSSIEYIILHTKKEFGTKQPFPILMLVTLNYLLISTEHVQ